MAWFMLIIAGLLEIVWASAMKRTEGFTRLWPSVLTIIAMVASFLLLARAMAVLPTGVSYAVWVGIGAVGTALVSVLLLGERLNLSQWACIALIAAGIVGLRLTAPAPAPSSTTPATHTPGDA